LKTKGVVSSEKALKSWKLALENLVNCDQVLDCSPELFQELLKLRGKINLFISQEYLNRGNIQREDPPAGWLKLARLP
jgi:hypothetical protein